MDISVVLPCKNEARNLESLLPDLHDALSSMSLSYEILVIDAGSNDGTDHVAARHKASYWVQQNPGYGEAILEGISKSEAPFVLTMDADNSHPSIFVQSLWEARTVADLVIASRYIDGGEAKQPWVRAVLSRMLNKFLRKGLSINVRDMSSGYRLYNRRIFDEIKPQHKSFVVLVEILLLAYQKGYRISEIPFQYAPRIEGRSNARVISFGLDYLKLFAQMWKIRNSIDFPDYDWRAYDSRIWLQRYWQRKRFDHIMYLTPKQAVTADIGCGSSRILAALPHAVGIDMRVEKLKFMRTNNKLLLQANGCRLPFSDNSFECVINSQVIEHIPDEGGRLLDELTRILKPEGILVIGTPDYGNWQWQFIEWFYIRFAPGAYGEEHVTQYTFASLTKELEARGFKILEHRYILQGELIIKAMKM